MQGEAILVGGEELCEAALLAGLHNLAREEQEEEGEKSDSDMSTSMFDLNL